jgi:hypothetical protein
MNSISTDTRNKNEDEEAWASSQTRAFTLAA